MARAQKIQPPKRARRTDEDIEQQLLEKLQKVQERIAKKHSKVYAEIGYLFCKMAAYDVAQLSGEQKAALEEKNDTAKAIIKEIAAAIK